MNLTKITTEKRNKNSTNIDKVSTIEILSIINNEDAQIAAAIKKELPNIGQAVDLIYDKFNNGGRLIYIGAGSSGRIGILDASEMLPTYGISNDRVFGIIAGGQAAIQLPQEGVEDDELLAIEDLKAVNFNANDSLVGITASGRTPYVLSALRYCQEVGGLAIGFAMSENPELAKYSDKTITVVTGQEVVTGSTRMKAGSATKLVLNMISTSLMIKSGKVYQNLMVDVVATNEKLRYRVAGIVETLTNADHKTIIKTLEQCNYSCKNAIVMIVKKVDYQTSVQLLQEHNGKIAEILS